MAGLPWFELDVDMPDDPKCVALGVRLKTPLAFGYVVRLYAYCYRHGTDTFIGLGAPGTIETACGWRGRVGQLLSALLAEGFIDQVPAATYVVHGVSKRLGPHLAKRERDAERLRQRRANVARTSQRQPSDVQGDNDNDNETDNVDGTDHRNVNGGDSSRQSTTPFDRLRIDVSQSLGLFGPCGTAAIKPPAGRNLGEQIRNAVAAIDRHGLDVVRDACVTHARSSGQTPETMTFFARTIAALAAGEEAQPQKRRAVGRASDFTTKESREF